MLTQSWDTAIKAGKANDASACATFYHDENTGRHYLLDMLVLRAEYPFLKHTIIAHAEKFKPDAVLIEDKASGQSLLQDLKHISHFSCLAVQPKGDKITRLARASAWIEAGKVMLPHDASWLDIFEAEIMGFPNMTHDDQVDAFSQYICWAMDRDMRRKFLIRRV